MALMKYLLKYMSVIYRFISELENRVELNENKEFTDSILPEFWLTKPLPIKIEQYVEHFLYQLNASEPLLVIAYLILEDLLPDINSHNIHRVLFTGLVISYKFLNDKPILNSELERIGGLKTGKLLRLELALLDRTGLSFNFMRYSETQDYLLQLKQKSANLFIEEEQNQDNHEDEDLETEDSFSQLSYLIGERDK